MADNKIALVCVLHPATKEKQTRCLEMLRRSAREYYRSPEANCTTWSYSTSSNLAEPDDFTLFGMEIYTTKQAFSDQLNDPVYFRPYRKAVEEENLYAEVAEHVAWYPAAGFIARKTNAEPFGNVLISVSRLVCINRDALVDLLRDFAEWVKGNEAGVLTYSVFTRPKAPKEVLLFGRYINQQAMQQHGEAPEHQTVVKHMLPLLDTNTPSPTTFWREVEDSFVSNVVGSHAQTEAKI